MSGHHPWPPPSRRDPDWEKVPVETPPPDCFAMIDDDWYWALCGAAVIPSLIESTKVWGDTLYGPATSWWVKDEWVDG